MAVVNQNLKNLLGQPVDRREFLLLAASAAAALVGISRILELLTGHSAHASASAGGWGHTAYGGPDNK